ncbi:MAG: alkaline phosphatase PhoX [Myxococcota bacterium]
MDRRHFLKGSALAAGAAMAGSSRPARADVYGELVADPDGLLDLPEGFSYVIVERVGETMSDGFRVPAGPDGMACFALEDGTLALLRNHELDEDDLDRSAFADGVAEPEETYAAGVYGGVSRVIVDPASGARMSSNLVLTGTKKNCAGGPSPWGWLSCEENTDPGHGYVFVCPQDAAQVRAPEKIASYGRFRHEAVAVDPKTCVAYLTEDQDPSAIYRFVPDDVSEPFVGQLQALVVSGEENLALTADLSVGDTLPIEWTDLDDPEPPIDTLRFTAWRQGAASLRRGEGAWFADGVVYLVSTNGGPIGGGQIFALRPDEGSLELIAQSEDLSVLSNPDNITVSPWGQVFIAEDTDGTCYLRAIDADGQVVPFARNAASTSEFAGVCFSPDGRWMFVNSQGDGITYAITGSFPEVQADAPSSSVESAAAGCHQIPARAGATATLIAALGMIWIRRVNDASDLG